MQKQIDTVMDAIHEAISSEMMPPKKAVLFMEEIKSCIEANIEAERNEHE